jgi:hypothetical protein
MAKRHRQHRYLTSGAGAGLVTVETLVPPEGRQAILRLAARLRKAARARPKSETAQRPIDVDAVVAKVRALCAEHSVRPVLSQSDRDRLIVTSVNVPFARQIDSEQLAAGIRSGRIPSGYRGHFERFLGEIPLNRLLSFFDRHAIDAETVRGFLRKNAVELALHRPDLDEHLHALSR